MLSLVEMAEKNIKADDAEAMMKKMMSNKFDFDDFLKQFKMVSGMGGGMTSVMKMLPGKFPISVFCHMMLRLLLDQLSYTQCRMLEGICWHEPSIYC